MSTRKPSVSHYPGGTRLSDWWSGFPTGHPLSLAARGLQSAPTIPHDSSQAWVPLWQKCWDLLCSFPLALALTSHSVGLQYHICPKGDSSSTQHALQPRSPNFKAPHSEEQISSTFYQFYNFKVHILSLLMRAIYTVRPRGRNVIILVMCAQTV